MERAWKDSVQRYFDLGSIGIATTSPAKRIFEVNNELFLILGYERDKLLLKTWAEITHLDDLESDVVQFNRVLSGEIDGYRLDRRWIRKIDPLCTFKSRASAPCERMSRHDDEYRLSLKAAK